MVHAVPPTFLIISAPCLRVIDISRSSQSPETIAALCDGLRQELEERDIKKFVNSILTTHVVKTPPDHEAGLALLSTLRGWFFLYFTPVYHLTDQMVAIPSD